MRTFKVGDKVRIKGPAKPGEDVLENGYWWVSEMGAFLGVTTEVTMEAWDGSYEVGADGGTYRWLAKWLEPVTTEGSPTPDMEEAFEAWWESFCEGGGSSLSRDYVAYRAWEAATEVAKRN